MEARLVNTKSGLKVRIYYYDKNNILKRASISLRKIAVGGLITIGLGITSAVGIYSTINEKALTIEAPLEIANNLGQEEDFINQQLISYYVTYQEYSSIINQENYNQSEMIEKRVELISQTRNMQKGAIRYLKERVLQLFDLKDLGLNKEDIEVSVFSSKDGFCGITIQNKKAEKEEERSIFYTQDIPKEMVNILSLTEKIEDYNGTGDNLVWNEEINSFMKTGNQLYRSIIDLTGKNFVMEDGKVKIEDSEKAEKSM